LYSSCQAAIFALAAANDRNQFVFKHSSRCLALKVLEVGVVRGLAGPQEVHSNAALVGPSVQGLAYELGAVVDPDDTRNPTLLDNAFEDCTDLLAFNILRC
jgi:hypothetical protein